MSGAAQKQDDKHRHHFTPILYLKNFTDANGDLHVVRRKDGKRFNTGPKGIGFEKDLYWPDSLEEGEDPNVYENQFADFEGKAGPVIDSVIATRQLPKDDDQLGLLFNFIAFQMVRTPSMRRVIAAPREHTARIIIDMLESSKELYESHARKAGYSLEEHPWEKLQATKGGYEPRLTTEGFIEGAMQMMTTILQYLHHRSWHVLVSEKPTESFVVSDHPSISNGRMAGAHATHQDTRTRTRISRSLWVPGRHSRMLRGFHNRPGHDAGLRVGHQFSDDKSRARLHCGKRGSLYSPGRGTHHHRGTVRRRDRFGPRSGRRVAGALLSRASDDAGVSERRSALDALVAQTRGIIRQAWVPTPLTVALSR